jgi:pyruvate formate lyase activating enzyme
METLRRARGIGLEEGLRYVYLGNEAGEENTCCHGCGRVLIRRSGYRIRESRVPPDGRCPACGAPVAGVGMQGANSGCVTGDFSRRSLPDATIP